jgi:hypothetical protein
MFNQELAKIIFWMLGRENISSHKIQKEFHMGSKKADELLEELYKLNLISDQFAKQPRKVLPACVEDLSEEVVRFLERNGNTSERVEKLLDAKGGRSGEM